MKTGMRPMDVQSPFLRDDLRQYEIPARAGTASPARAIVVRKELYVPNATRSDNATQSTDG
ncbi:hypothetical protein [Bradyrhizobium roseum]|uniref:hypothetical protein n=1 Tax=Bradyrhizobium roseum TaxID=3056648 RepID=UPI00262ECC89|nr:hypothetical protein [Bradyrhizobium roseus]WKA31239.1 hypothetical protein QUH67_14190 [Bradyrhizobium roseus]